MIETKISQCKFSELSKIVNQYDFVLVDENIYDLYPALLKSYTGNILQYKAIEKNKSISQFEKYCLDFLKLGVKRSSRILIIGGGLTSDFGGFVSMALLRGIECSIIPTTLLSMIDACYGGKVGVNTELGKNLIGGFYPASEVYLCSEFLDTLPIEELNSAKGEMLKYYFISPDIRELMHENLNFEHLIIKCLEFKRNVCEIDPREKGLRKVLNFGHTLGHAIELGLGMKHGQAIMYGIFFALSVNHKEGQLDKVLRVFGIHEYFYQNLLVVLKYLKTDKCWDYVFNDKKSQLESKIDFILFNGKEAEIVKFDFGDLKRKILGSRDV